MSELDERTYQQRLDAEQTGFAERTRRDAATVDLHELGPIIGVAPHHSHRVRKPTVERMAIDEADRLYEEDPYTERFVAATAHRITPNQSRYEVDVNRPPHEAVYMGPEMAWGATIWAEDPPRELVETSMERWHEFHAILDQAVQHAIDTYGRAIVLDLHSYNYQREGATDWRTDEKPVVNLGTRYLQLDEETRELKDWFLDQLDQVTVLGEEALVEENSVFYGGYVNRRLSRKYGEDCLTLSVEFKKVFMDERTGQAHPKVLADLADQFDRIVHELGRRLGAPVLEEPEPPSTVGSYPRDDL
jgi:N-formylglutamate amidohydrolase